MTATTTAPPIGQLAPGVRTRVSPGDLDGKQRSLLIVGGVALIASLLGMFASEEGAEQFLFSYLVAYMFTLGIALGSLFFVLIHHATRAGWSVVVRRVAENMMAVLWPWMVLLFLPIAVGYHDLYHHWAAADPADQVLAGKSGYLSAPFFFVRAAIYFAIWIGLARFMRNKSLEQDENGDPALSLRMARVAAPGLLLFALSITFAAFDWIMSLDPHWFSTIFGVTYFSGAVVATLASLGLFCMWLRRNDYLHEIVNVEHYHDIGKLLFAFMIFWTYVNFSQYMLIWYANLPEETGWFLHRQGGWEIIGQVLVFGHFFIPFAFLMSRHIKRNLKTLAIGAIFMLVMHWFDMLFLIMPTLHEGAVHVSWLDLTTMVGVVGLFFAFALRNVISSPLIPERDPRLPESFKFVNH